MSVIIEKVNMDIAEQSYTVQLQCNHCTVSNQRNSNKFFMNAGVFLHTMLIKNKAVYMVLMLRNNQKGSQIMQQWVGIKYLCLRTVPGTLCTFFEDYAHRRCSVHTAWLSSHCLLHVLFKLKSLVLLFCHQALFTVCFALNVIWKMHPDHCNLLSPV